MTFTSTDEPVTREEFDETLRELINRAHANGISVEDGLDVRNADPGMPSWTVEITRLADGQDD